MKFRVGGVKRLFQRRRIADKIVKNPAKVIYFQRALLVIGLYKEQVYL